MKRRSFFGVVFGALVALRLPWRRRPLVLHDERFKAMSLLRHMRDREGPIPLPPPAQRLIVHPMAGGFYKPGDTFEIIGPGGPGNGPLHKVDIDIDSDA